MIDDCNDKDNKALFRNKTSKETVVKSKVWLKLEVIKNTASMFNDTKLIFNDNDDNEILYPSPTTTHLIACIVD